MLVCTTPESQLCRKPGRSRRFLVADVVGYSRLAGVGRGPHAGAPAGASAATSSIPPSPRIMAASSSAPATASIIEFRSVVDAVRCAIEVQNGHGRAQRRACRQNAASSSASASISATSSRRRDGDLMGDGVNVCGPAGRDLRARRGFVCQRTPTGRSSRGSTLRSPISGRKASRTSPSRCAPTLLRQGAPATQRPLGAATSKGRLVAFALARGARCRVVAAGGYAWRAGFAPRLLRRFCGRQAR